MNHHHPQSLKLAIYWYLGTEENKDEEKCAAQIVTCDGVTNEGECLDFSIRFPTYLGAGKTFQRTQHVLGKPTLSLHSPTAPSQQTSNQGSHNLFKTRINSHSTSTLLLSSAAENGSIW